jgi:hypothetical protein
MSALMIILSSGIFLSASWKLEQMYRGIGDEVDTFYQETYKLVRLLALLILGVGIYFYLKTPLPYVFAYRTQSFFIAYHMIICLTFLYLGALLFQKLMDTFK